jgi:hypothetical protein
MMLGLHRTDADELRRTTSELLERIQHLESEQSELRAKLEGDRQLRFLIANIMRAALVAPTIGAAVERFAQAMRARLRRGRAGGLARARTAWRYLDGTFMPESAKLEGCLAEYERYAAGGRRRAATADRSSDGKFLPHVV